MNNMTLSPQSKRIVAGVALILGLLFEYFFVEKQPGFSFFLYIALILSGFFSLSYFFKISYNKNILWYAVPILFFSGMVVVRDSMFLLFWNVVMIAGLLLVFAHHSMGKSIRDYKLFDYVTSAILVPLKMGLRAFTALAEALAINKSLREGEKYSQVIRGILITVPILIIFIFLFASADLVFESYVTKIFNFQVSERTIGFIVRTIFFTLIWLGSFSYTLENTVSATAPSVTETETKRKFRNIEVGILLGSISVLFLAFVIIQISYLFAGHEAITSLGFIYAEYAHRGFAELILTSLVTFGILFVIEKFIHKQEQGHNTLFKSLSTILIALVLLIMASAFFRLYIYEQAYSFTLLRILVQAFIIWLGVIFLWLLYQIYKSIEENTFFFGCFLSVIAFFTIFNLLNPDAYIARKNIEQFARAGKLDMKYLSSLSADAVPEITKLLDFTGYTDKFQKDLYAAAAELLQRQKNRYNEQEFQAWQSYNLSRENAKKLINQKLK